MEPAPLAPPTAADRRAGAFVYDLTNERCVFCSAGFARLHGLQIDGCRKLSPEARVARFVHPDDRAAYRREIEAARRARRPYSVVYRWLAQDELRVLQESAEPWDDPESGTLRLVGFVDDVTDQVRTETELKRAKAELEQRVAERTAELAAAKDEAELAEHEAKAAHERFYAAAEGLADGLAIYDENDQLVYFNRRYPELAPPAFRQAMAIGRRFEDIVREAVRLGGMYHAEMGDDFLERRLAHRARAAEDQEFRIADGRWMRVRENALPGGGRVLLVHDITARRSALEELEEREQRLRAIADGIPLPLIIARIRQPEILFVNERAARVFGLRLGPQPEAIRYAYVEPGARQRLIERLVEEGAVEGFEAGLRRADGSAMWAMLYARLIPVAGEMVMLTAVSDITERKAALDQLAEREEQFRTIAESAPLSLVIARLDPPEVLFANARAHETFGLSPGARGAEVISVYGDPAERTRLIDLLGREGRVDNREIRFRRPDGSPMWALISARLVTFRGEPAMLTTAIDISERKAAEQALRESEARLSAFVAHAPVAMYLKNVDGRYELVPPHLLKASGRTAEQALGRTVRDLFDRGYAELVEAHDREVLERGEAIAHEEFVPRPGGQRGWSLVIRFPLRDPSGAITHIGGFHVEIDERKAMEEALRKSEQRFKVFAEAHPVPVVISRIRSNQIIFASPPFLRLFKATPEDLADGRLERFYERPEMRRTVLERIAAEGEVTGLEVRLRRADGELFWGSFSSRLIEYEGAPAVVSSVIDVTERKRVEEQLRESEQRFRILAEAHPVPLVIVGVEDAVVMVASPACEAFFGVETERLVGASILPFYVDPGDRTLIMERMRREKRLDGFQVRVRRADGTTFWAAFDSRLIEFAGKPAVVAAYVDLTDKKAAEAELERQREALMQSERMSVLGSLLASVAHELNNPLSVVVGQAAMLEELAAGTEMARRAGKIRNAGDRCARIVRTFLAMARSKPPAFREVNLNELIRSALELTVYGLRSTGVTVELDLADDLPLLSADGDQLHQVLTNLIINAKQAMQGVGGERILHIRTALEDGDVALEIEDTGPGIAEEVRDKIFAPFYTTKPAGVGTGIGLAVCRRIVQAHGGAIEVGGGDQGGARFTVRLPVSRAAVELRARDEAGPPDRPAAGRALVVDDEPDIADVLAEILRLDGFKVDVANGGREALERLAAGGYDLVISDLRMPDMDGPALFRSLEKSRPEMARRMVFVTGDTLSPDASTFLEASGMPVIEKPFEAQQIRKLAAEHIARLRAATGAEA